MHRTVGEYCQGGMSAAVVHTSGQRIVRDRMRNVNRIKGTQSITDLRKLEKSPTKVSILPARTLHIQTLAPGKDTALRPVFGSVFGVF